MLSVTFAMKGFTRNINCLFLKIRNNLVNTDNQLYKYHLTGWLARKRYTPLEHCGFSWLSVFNELFLIFKNKSACALKTLKKKYTPRSQTSWQFLKSPDKNFKMVQFFQTSWHVMSHDIMTLRYFHGNKIVFFK